MYSSRFMRPLLTPDPHYIPGYTGYCPQFKYRCGRTYGMGTHDCLNDPTVPTSPRSVLANQYHDETKTYGGLYEQVGSAAANATHWGQHLQGPQVYTPRMKSGYTGHIPCLEAQNLFGQGYPDMCQRALERFNRDQRRFRDYYRELDNMLDQSYADNCRPGNMSGGTAGTVPNTMVGPCSPPTVPVCNNRSPNDPCGGMGSGQVPYDPCACLPLTKIRRDDQVTLPRYEPDTSKAISPYFMDSQDPNKTFIPGYTGYIPCNHYHIARTYPVATNQALKEFTSKLDKNLTNRWENVDVSGAGPCARTGPRPGGAREPIVYRDVGIIPNYTGHVPGEQFRFGQTFGISSRNAPKTLKEYKV